MNSGNVLKQEKNTMYKMLIVNDESSQSQSLLHTLREEFDNFLSDVQTATTEQETIQKNRKYMPDFIVMDVDLEKESWMETIRQVREENGYSQIILITVYDCFDRAVSLKVNDYLLRPLRLNTLTDSLLRLVDNISEYRKKSDYERKIRKDYEKASDALERIKEKYTHLIKTDEEDEVKSIPASDVVGMTDDYILKNYNKNITLEELAGEISMSRYHLCRVYREKTGVNFTNTLADIRILKSKELIIESDMAIRDVALSVGYTDASYFSRLFKKVTGITPTEYRKASYCMTDF